MISYKLSVRDLPDKDKIYYTSTELKYDGVEYTIEEMLEQFKIFLHVVGYSQELIDKICLCEEDE